VNGVWFVSVPTFNFNSEDNVKKIRDLISNLETKAPELRKSIVVFDVRGNHGGDSAWGEEIASAIWGRGWVKYIEDGFDNTVDWRASAGNIKWMEYIFDGENKVLST
jgi:C-terminal processing protease CtpA/Prc